MCVWFHLFVSPGSFVVSFCQCSPLLFLCGSHERSGDHHGRSTSRREGGKRRSTPYKIVKTDKETEGESRGGRVIPCLPVLATPCGGPPSRVRADREGGGRQGEKGKKKRKRKTDEAESRSSRHLGPPVPTGIRRRGRDVIGCTNQARTICGLIYSLGGCRGRTRSHNANMEHSEIATDLAHPHHRRRQPLARQRMPIQASTPRRQQRPRRQQKLPGGSWRRGKRCPKHPVSTHPTSRSSSNAKR